MRIASILLAAMALVAAILVTTSPAEDSFCQFITEKICSELSKNDSQRGCYYYLEGRLKKYKSPVDARSYCYEQCAKNTSFADDELMRCKYGCAYLNRRE